MAGPSSVYPHGYQGGATLGVPCNVRFLLSRYRDACLGRVDREGERLGEVKLHLVGVVRQVADRQVLAEAELVVAAAAGQQERAVDRGRPDDVAIDHAGHVLTDGVA